jgi:hypothetical protein
MSYTISATAPLERGRNSLAAHRIANRNQLKEGFAINCFGPRANR